MCLLVCGRAGSFNTHPLHVAIMLGTLRMNYDDIRDMVLSVDGEKMTEQVIQQLLKFLPTKEEVCLHGNTCMHVHLF